LSPKELPFTIFDAEVDVTNKQVQISGEPVGVQSNNISMIHCGDEHSFFVVNNKAYVCGQEKNGRLGVGQNAESLKHPTLIKAFNVIFKGNNDSF